MRHPASPEDIEFRRAFESGGIPPSGFDHAAHVRLAYVYLCQHEVDGATGAMRDALVAFLRAHGIPATKYHETLTRAWVLAVDHFMQQAPGPYPSAAVFMQANPRLLDSRIMLTHYSAEVLFSAEARERFVPPDVQSIPPPA